MPFPVPSLSLRWLALFVLGIALGGCTTPPAVEPTVAVTTAKRLADVRVMRSGTYKVRSANRRNQAGAIGEGVIELFGKHDFVETADVPKQLGASFGVGFVFPTLADDEFASVQVRWRFPNPGLVDPARGRATWQSHNLQCRGECSVGWTLTEEWELVPGTWTVEVLAEGEILLSRSFEVR